MSNRTHFYRYGLSACGLLLFLSLVLSACSAAASVLPTQFPPTSAPNATSTARPSGTPLPPTLTSTATATFTATPTPTPTATPAPLLPFITKLPANVIAVAYLKDTCQVLSARWSPLNSPPGTIVVPVMIHSIAKPGRAITDDTTITEEYYLRFIERAHMLGYATITTAQLVDFLNNNAKIPPLALMLIVDDRKRAEFFETYFIPYLKKYNWTVTNAWIAHPDTPAYLWQENEQFAPSGLVDFQAHGVIHNTPIDDSVTQEYIHSEIYGPIQPMLQHFGKRPIAFIWPRGLFTPPAVQVARQAGYQVGFTATPRGPLLFDWIPLGEVERLAADPLMVLPRYWDTTAIAALEEGLQVSQAAQAFYAGQKSTDLAYLSQYCPADQKTPVQ